MYKYCECFCLGTTNWEIFTLKMSFIDLINIFLKWQNQYEWFWNTEGRFLSNIQMSCWRIFYSHYFDKAVEFKESATFCLMRKCIWQNSFSICESIQFYWCLLLATSSVFVCIPHAHEQMNTQSTGWPILTDIQLLGNLPQTSTFTAKFNNEISNVRRLTKIWQNKTYKFQYYKNNPTVCFISFPWCVTRRSWQVKTAYPILHAQMFPSFSFI